MKNLTLAVILLWVVLLSVPQVHAASENRLFGLGLVLGAPTAITAKYYYRPDRAIDSGLAYVANDYFLVYGDFLWHYRDLIKSHDRFVAKLVPYLGIGGILAFSASERADDDHLFGKHSGSMGLGVRVPFGIEWKPGDPAIGVFGELAPGISIFPSTGALLEAGIGIRYYF